MPMSFPQKRPSRVQNWARSFNKLRDPYGVMASPPTITLGGSSSAINAFTSGNVSHRFDNVSLRHSGCVVINDGTNRGVGTGTTFADGSNQANNSPIRTCFVTDEPVFEACFRGTQFGQVGITVRDLLGGDQYAAKTRAISLPNSGNPCYVKFDFGDAANTRTYTLAQISKSAGGSGYAVGDQITLAGGTGTAAVLNVIQVSSGAVSLVEVLNIGAYTVVPTGTISQASTTGSGTGATFVSPIWLAAYATRRLREIEVIWHGSGLKLYGINVRSQGSILPYPAPPNQPILAQIGDSISSLTYGNYAGEHMGYIMAQRLGMADRCKVNAIGGTGWATVNSAVTPNGPAWSDDKRIADFVAMNADVYVFWGSQNDAAAGSSVVTAAVTKVLSALRANNPDCYLIGLGPIVASGAAATTLSSAIAAGFAAQDQTRTAYIDSTAEGWLMTTSTGKATAETGVGNWDFYVASDGAHPGGLGRDYLNYLASLRVATTLQSLVGT
ncbi:hypothetical protein RR42_m1692 [Cupriavidus basilensis]|uniref:SGNH/GDSL hydrolase family protein n=2 Tax=Cupriavidus basilensis TaxID=68895 RepID=A0A0C4YA15_9BURK|nr:hypothetical protein RR42_m1692 [Cupriavidus basilensis]